MLLTIFTPTYNRAHTIHRTFESLLRQKETDFEWLIIDDGSSDNTALLVEDFKAKAEFPIVYIKKENGGKHTAHNRALEVAKGKYFFTVDSDDWLPNNSISLIKKIISVNDLLLNDADFGGICALKVYPDGKLIGHEFSPSLEPVPLHRLAGEYTIIFKTSVAKQHPFPVVHGERFMTESAMYDNIVQKFVLSNDVLTICEYQPDGLSRSIKSLMVKNPGGYMLYYSQRIDLAANFKKRIYYAIRYHAFRHLYAGEKHWLRYNGKHKILCAALYLTSPFVAKHYLKSAK